MMRVVNQYWPPTAALILGFALAVATAPAVISVAAWYQTYWELKNPVATLKWHSIERLSADSLRFRLVVTRHRSCSNPQMTAYTGDSLDSMLPVGDVAREDGEPAKEYPIGISVVSAPWVASGLHGRKLAVGVRYVCGNRTSTPPLLVGEIPQ